VFPVAEIAAACRPAGVPVLVDGAHAAGMLPVNLDRLGADFWVGDLHEWVCAPKASAVLYAAPRWRATLRPPGGLARVLRTDQVCVRVDRHPRPDSPARRPGRTPLFDQLGWRAVREHNNTLARDGAELIAKRLGTPAPTGGYPGLAAAMRVVPLRESLDDAGARELERRLQAGHGVVVPVTGHGGKRWLRLSAQLYNTLADYERLAAALRPDGAG
jgi:isopenicillin-N epimerase